MKLGREDTVAALVIALLVVAMVLLFVGAAEQDARDPCLRTETVTTTTVVPDGRGGVTVWPFVATVCVERASSRKPCDSAGHVAR